MKTHRLLGKEYSSLLRMALSLAFVTLIWTTQPLSEYIALNSASLSAFRVAANLFTTKAEAERAIETIKKSGVYTKSTGSGWLQRFSSTEPARLDQALLALHTSFWNGVKPRVPPQPIGGVFGLYKVRLEPRDLIIRGGKHSGSGVVTGFRGKTVVVLNNGHSSLAYPLYTAASGTFKVRIRALQGVPAPINLQVSFGGCRKAVVFGEATDSWADREDEFSLKQGLNFLELEFTNDFYKETDDGHVIDRNAVIESIEIESADVVAPSSKAG